MGPPHEGSTPRPIAPRFRVLEHWLEREIAQWVPNNAHTQPHNAYLNQERSADSVSRNGCLGRYVDINITHLLGDDREIHTLCFASLNLENKKQTTINQTFSQ